MCGEQRALKDSYLSGVSDSPGYSLTLTVETMPLAGRMTFTRLTEKAVWRVANGFEDIFPLVDRLMAAGAGKKELTRLPASICLFAGMAGVVGEAWGGCRSALLGGAAGIGDFDAAVFGAAFVGFVVGDRDGAAVAFGAEAGGRDAFL